jgi:hypothetical protein
MLLKRSNKAEAGKGDINMIKFFIGGFFGFLVGMGYTMYTLASPEPSSLSKILHFIAKSKGVVESLNAF